MVHPSFCVPWASYAHNLELFYQVDCLSPYVVLFLKSCLCLKHISLILHNFCLFLCITLVTFPSPEDVYLCGLYPLRPSSTLSSGHENYVLKRCSISDLYGLVDCRYCLTWWLPAHGWTELGPGAGWKVQGSYASASWLIENACLVRLAVGPLVNGAGN